VQFRSPASETRYSKKQVVSVVPVPVHSILKRPVIRDLHSRGLLMPFGVLLIVGGVLVHGALNREPAAEAAPKQKTATFEPPPRPARPNLGKTPLTYNSDYWLQIAQQTRLKIELISTRRIPALVIEPNLAITSIEAADALIADQQVRQLTREHQELASAESASEALASGDGEPRESGPAENSETAPAEAESPQPSSPAAPSSTEEPEPHRLLSVDTELGIALFELDQAFDEPFALISPVSLPPGSFVAAVSVEPDQRLRITPGHLVSTEQTMRSEQDLESFVVSFDDEGAPPASAIVDLDGNLVGLALNSPGGSRLLAAPAVYRLVERLKEQPPCHSIEVAAVPLALTKLLRLREGIFVEKVRQDSFLPEPSIKAGDIILRWGGERVENTEQFYEFYEGQPPGSLARYSVLRGRRRIAGATRLPASDCRPLGEPRLSFPRLGVLLHWTGPATTGATDSMPGWSVDAVVEGSPAALGGLLSGDAIVAINGSGLVERTAARPLESFEEQVRPLVLTVQRDDRLKLVPVSAEGQTTP